MANLQTATFGAGCFWGVEEVFRAIPGVKETAVGYEGGELVNPTYKDVYTDTTGHAEVVEVKFDPTQVGFETLLDAFWKNHNPTTLNRQGPDEGTQYRSVIFFHSPEQETIARRSIQEMDARKAFPRPIVTQVVPATKFWVAEEYHQKYLAKRGMSHCHI